MKNQLLNKSEVLVVHCVDAEGPLNETVCATFERLKYIFGIDLAETEENYELLRNGQIEGANEEITSQLRLTFSGGVLDYNRNWDEVQEMNSRIFSDQLRESFSDDFGNLWKITWFCLDHVNYKSNPRQKPEGFSVVFNYYRNLISKHERFGDELQWHYHPKSITKNPIAAATSYVNSMDEILQILCRKVIEDEWFPTVYRPGFHSERQDANLFLEQWFPFDFGNQRFDDEINQKDMQFGRFGNWTRAPKTWRGYNPSSKHLDLEGGLTRRIFRCLNLGTRLRLLSSEHIREAFEEAHLEGLAVIAFTDHDFRDIEPDISKINAMLADTKIDFPDVKVRFCTAEEAAQRITDSLNYEFKLSAVLNGERLEVKEHIGEVFGSQPFLAIKTKSGDFLHDNFDYVSSNETWFYTFDEQTIHLSDIAELKVGSAGLHGGYSVIDVLKT
jgi:hypothetical protein